MQRCLIAYDVASTQARSAIARKLEKAGRRLQKSVFIVECGEGRLLRLERELQDLLEDGDSLLVLPLCATCQKRARIYADLPPLMVIGR